MYNDNNKIETGNLNEMALEGVSHLLGLDDWFQLIPNRMRNNDNPQTLGAEFIRNHKNDMNMALLTMWAARMCDMPEMRSQFDMDFCRQFWRYMRIDGGNAAQLAYQNTYRGNTGWFKENIISKLYDKNLTQLLLDCFDKPTSRKWKLLPTCADYEKNPYFYDACQLDCIIGMNEDVPDEFLERFVHLVSFNTIFENAKLSMERKTQILNKFSVPIEKSTNVLFPCGTIVDSASEYFQKREEGEAFYDNVARYCQGATEKAIRDINAKFPRAVKDCLDPQNALAMQSK